MSRKGENVYMRKDGRWEGRYLKGRTAEGKSLYGSVYARTYREVKQKLTIQKLLVMESAGNTGGESAGARPDFLFSDTASEWLAGVRCRVKESTYVKYWNILNTYILPELGAFHWNELNLDIIETFCNGLLTSGGRKSQGLSAETTACILSLTRGIFRYAASHGHSPGCDISVISIKHEKSELRILNRDEQERLCGKLYQDMNLLNLGILVCLFTGIRVGEICALKWEDISFEDQTIYVHRTLQRLQVSDQSDAKTKIVVSTPKSRSSIRQIPIPCELAELLTEYRSAPDAYVLTGRTDTYAEPRTMQRQFKRMLQSASLQPFNYHVLRHTFATRCVEMDFDVKSLSEILGHSSVNITMNRYVHPSIEVKRANMQRFSELLTVR